MENQAILNPDTRALPYGWVQHYEPTKQMWYYLHVAVTPPTVSFIHPTDLIGGTVNSARSSTAAGPQFNPTMRHLPNGQTTFSSMRPQGMTVAQKLYASSGATAAPMINANSITTLSTSVDAASNPSPPPASNRVSMLPSPISTSTLGSESSRPLSYFPQPRSSIQGTRTNPHNNNRPGASLYASARESSVDVLYSSIIRGDHNPHRAATAPATAPAFPMPTTTVNTNHERLHSQSVGSVSPNSYSTMSRPRPTPHIVTKARAPPLDTGMLPGKVGFATSPFPPLNVQSTSPPSTSLLFSKPAENLSPSSYNRPESSLSGTSTITPQIYNHFGISQQSNQLGPVDATLGTNAGGLNPAGLLAMLKTALSMNPIAESELRAVAYSELNANYQAVVNALKQQQRHRPITSTQVQLPSGVGVQHRPTVGSVDYQLLITEVGRLEIKATLVQQSQHQAQHQALDSIKKQQEAALAQQQQQQSLLNQQAQEHALLNSHLQQQQNTTLTQQQALLNQQTQEQAILKLHIHQQQQAVLNQQAQEQALKLQIQQHQQATISQQQAILKQQAEEQAALKMQLQQQQQQMLAPQQPLMQANQMNQQQLHVLQQQLSAHSQPHQSTPSAAAHHQAGQQQQQQQGGLGTLMSSVMGGQQNGGQENSSISQQVASHLFNSVANSFQQGSGASDPSASGATSCGDAGNQGLMDPITQNLNGGSQDPSSGLFGLFGASGNLDFSSMVPGNTESNMDYSGFASGLDFSSFGSGDC